LNRVFDEDENLLEWISKFTKKPIIAEGNIKSPMVLKDISMLRLADWYVMERSIYARPQWFQFLKRKLVS
ncbi:MAG: NADH:flavin oxidoreductase, partial [SAR324 cluster bacterium]|nr:NADH:flavin oxidoreductase [SAR324 cluster bacterium]